MAIFFNSFTPLLSGKPGRDAIAQYDIPPFVDASCRREPDVESKFPSISSLCRGRLFAPRVHEGDMIVYITRKGRYLDEEERHWRLVAILEVAKRFESHEDAASWYRGQNIPLPSNCMVRGNPPKPLDMTNRRFKPASGKNYGQAKESKGCEKVAPCGGGDADGNDLLKAWDSGYKARARKWGTFLVCCPLYVELREPPIITEDMMLDVFSRIPGTRNPGTISPDEYARLQRACNVSVGRCKGPGC